MTGRKRWQEVAPGAVGNPSEVTRTGLSPIGQSTNQNADLPTPANERAGAGQVTGLGVVGLSSGWSVAMEQLVVILLAASVAGQVIFFSSQIVNWERCKMAPVIWLNSSFEVADTSLRLTV